MRWDLFWPKTKFGYRRFQSVMISRVSNFLLVLFFSLSHSLTHSTFSLIYIVIDTKAHEYHQHFTTFGKRAQRMHVSDTSHVSSCVCVCVCSWPGQMLSHRKLSTKFLRLLCVSSSSLSSLLSIVIVIRQHSMNVLHRLMCSIMRIRFSFLYTTHITSLVSI